MGLSKITVNAAKPIMEYLMSMDPRFNWPFGNLSDYAEFWLTQQGDCIYQFRGRIGGDIQIHWQLEDIVNQMLHSNRSASSLEANEVMLEYELPGGLFLRWAWGSSGSSKMLEAILSFRAGGFSSAPKEMLEAPPGGRKTLNKVRKKKHSKWISTFHLPAWAN